MRIEINSRLNRLLRALPSGSVVTSARLQELGISHQLASKYVQNAWLDRVGFGAFARSGDVPDWLGGLYALQVQLGLSVHIAAVSALELQGRAHFIPIGAGRRVILLSDGLEHLPKWFVSHPWSVTIDHRCVNLFRECPEDATIPWDYSGFSVRISPPERAILEEMHLVGNNTDVEHAILLMDGLSTLRPAVVQNLLEQCTSIKAKRLFLWAAGQSQHTWAGQIDASKIDLGSGKRQIFKGGVFDHKYMITVPEREDVPNV